MTWPRPTWSGCCSATSSMSMPPMSREEHQRALRGAVPDDPGVVLLLDLGFGIDEDAARHRPVDLQLEDRLGVLGGLVRGVGELDAAGLHPAAGQHLRLDHDRAADLLGDLACFLGGRAEAVLGDGNPRQLDDLARLVLVEPHRGGHANRDRWRNMAASSRRRRRRPLEVTVRGGSRPRRARPRTRPRRSSHAGLASVAVAARGGLTVEPGTTVEPGESSRTTAKPSLDEKVDYMKRSSPVESPI